MHAVRNYFAGRGVTKYTPIYLSFFPEDRKRIQLVRNVYGGTNFDTGIIQKFERIVEIIKNEAA